MQSLLYTLPLFASLFAQAPAPGPAPAPQGNAELAGIHNVYLLPMRSGLDQYIAGRLTDRGVYRVVTDPDKADAIFTDKLGKQFETTMAELYPTAAAPAAPTPKADAAKKIDSGGLDFDVKSSGAMRTTSFSSGRGMVFLVHRHTRGVLWSTFVKIENTRAPELNEVAGTVVKRLERDLKGR